MAMIRQILKRLKYAPGLALLNQMYLFAKDRELARAMREPDLERRFSVIYRNGHWLDNTETRSGRGSTLASTRRLRERLPSLLRELGVTRLFDAGCGDFHWMRTVERDFDYTGGDVVGEVIAENEAAHGDPRTRFIRYDATRDAIPPCDAVLTREMMFHLAFADIAAFLSHLRQSRARFLLATSDTELLNVDIASGDQRGLDLCRPPLSFPQPQLWVEDDEQMAGRRLGVWRVADLPFPASIT